MTTTTAPAARKVTLSRATTISDEPCYRVLVDGEQVGLVRRDENVTASYWGAWRGGLATCAESDDEDGVYFREPIRAETRRGAVALVIARFADKEAES